MVIAHNWSKTGRACASSHAIAVARCMACTSPRRSCCPRHCPAHRGRSRTRCVALAWKALSPAGKVRAGLTPRTRAEVFERIREHTISACPFVNLPNSAGKSHWGEGITAEEMTTLRWVKPRVVIEVAFTEWTAGGNLRHASFEALRDDKAAADVRRV
jgi:ATP-dependent DNA ligase